MVEPRQQFSRIPTRVHVFQSLESGVPLLSGEQFEEPGIPFRPLGEASSVEHLLQSRATSSQRTFVRPHEIDHHIDRGK